MAKTATQTATNKKKSRGLWGEVVRRIVRNKGAMVGMAITILLIVLSCSADLIYDYETDIVRQDIINQYKLPGQDGHIFGTDDLGRDIFKRIVYGTKYSMLIGALSTVLSTIMSLVIGSIAGYFGGKLDNFIMRACDIIGAIPALLLGLVIVAALGPNLINLIFALAIGNLAAATRVVRAAVLTVRNSEYVESARSIGMPEWKIISKYIIPNCMAPIIVSVTLRVGTNIITASSLSFLGLGVQPPAPEWGAMLSEGRNVIRYYPHLTLFPGLAIMITVLALNMFGDGLRDAMDPKLRR